MKKLHKLFTAAFLVLFVSTTFAQSKVQKPLENSLLWEVSGKGLTKPSFLFGTIHMICSPDFIMTEQAKNAFAKTDKLTLEIDMSDPEQMTAMQKMAMGDKPLSETLTATEYARLDAIVQKHAGISVKQLDSFSLVTVMSVLSSRSFGCTDLKFYEMEFIEMAKNSKKPVSGLETVQDQIALFEEGISTKDILEMMEAADDKVTKNMVEIYKKQNLQELFALTTDEKMMTAEARKLMLDNRNIKWLEVIPAMMKKESVFFAVGAAHLPGQNGVIELLRKAGYTVKAVIK